MHYQFEMNYTLYLSYIVTKNVSEIHYIDNRYMFVTPISTEPDPFYNKIMSTFSSFLSFNEETLYENENQEQDYSYAIRFYTNYFKGRSLSQLVDDYNLYSGNRKDYDFVMFLDELLEQLPNLSLCELNIKIACEMYRIGNRNLCRNILNDAIRTARISYNANCVEKGLRYLNKM